MKKIAKVHVGVDISKDFVDLHVHENNHAWRQSNTEKGMEYLLRRLSRFDVEHIVCESSGGYEQLLVRFFKSAGYPVWQVNPERIKAFRRSQGIRYKTDKADAKLIAHFATLNKCPYQVVELSQQESDFRTLVRRKAKLVRMCAKEKTSLKMPSQSVCKDNIQKHIEYLNSSVKEIMKQIESIVDHHHDLERKLEILTSCPGIGKDSALSLIGNVPELGKITGKKVAALTGTAPMIQQSGNQKGVAYIYGGRRDARHDFYMAAFNATKYNPVIASFYEKLRSTGKSHKMAIVACMRRMIVIVNAMVRKDELWNANISA